MIAMTGLPAQSAGAYPICIKRERWLNERKSSGANQRALRSEFTLCCAMVQLSRVRMEFDNANK